MLTLYNPRDLTFEVNAFFEQVIGWTNEEMQQPDAMDKIYPESQYRALAIEYVRSLQSGFKDFLMTTKSGVTVETSWANIMLGDGRQVGIGLDIRQRKHMENQIRSYAEQLHSILQNITDGVMVYSPDGTLIIANPAARKISGFDEINENCIQLYDENGMRLPFENWPVCRALRGETFIGQQYRMIHPEKNSENFIEYSSALIRNNKGDISTIVITMHDITRQKNYERSLKEAKELIELRAEGLAAANRELEAFSYSVSHDLRNPLRTIRGFCDILLEDYANRLDETGQDYIARIIKGADRMDSLIEDMLSLSRVSRQEMNLQEIDITALAYSILSELAENHPERNVDISVQHNLSARGDERLLRIALTNLLGNAWKYTGKSSEQRIEFGAFTRDEETVFFVRDNGVGFSMEHADKLFKPFQRLHSESQFSGTGIGLAIVERIVKRHGGSIWAESETGKGATFYFQIIRESFNQGIF